MVRNGTAAVIPLPDFSMHIDWRSLIAICAQNKLTIILNEIRTRILKFTKLRFSFQ